MTDIPIPGIKTRFIQGAAWSLAMRWGLRGIGFVSMLVLARLLTPADFGLVAMGSLVVGLLQRFSELGVSMLLIRVPEATRAHCDTAWTVRVLQGVLIAVLLWVLAVPATHYFGDPRAADVIRVMALCALIQGFANVGMILVRRELDFATDFRYVIYTRLVSFVVGLSAALLLRNYWALVLAMLAASIAEVVFSYTMHSFRPCWSLVQVRDYLRFSLSVIPFNIGDFLNSKVDVLVAGGLGDTTALGRYQVASELSAQVTQEIVVPLGRSLYPNFARLRHEPQQISVAFLRVLAAVLSLCLPIVLLVSVYAHEIVEVLLGPAWDATGTLVQWLAWYGLGTSLHYLMSGQILIVTGHERLSAWLMWLRLAVLVPCVWVASQGGITSIAVGTVVAAGVMLPVTAVWVCRTLGVRLLALCNVCLRPLLAVTATFALLILLPPVAPGALTRLLWQAPLALGAYLTVLFAAWHLAGRPEGPETLALRLCRQLPRRKR